MKIKMNTAIAGEGFAVSHGETTERFSDAECKRLIAAGLAEEVKPVRAKRSTKKTEKAVLEPVETAMIES